MRPFFTVTLLDEVAEATPFKHALRDGAAELHFALADAHNLPIAATRAAVDIELLSHLEGIRLENEYCVLGHGIHLHT